MPITQSRVLAIIQAANDYRQGLALACRIIRDTRQAVAIGKLTPDQALTEIASSINLETLLIHPVDSQVTIEIEDKYFKRNYQRNASAAIWQANRRAEQRGDIPARPKRELEHITRTIATTPVTREKKKVSGANSSGKITGRFSNTITDHAAALAAGIPIASDDDIGASGLDFPIPNDIARAVDREHTRQHHEDEYNKLVTQDKDSAK